MQTRRIPSAHVFYRLDNRYGYTIVFPTGRIPGISIIILWNLSAVSSSLAGTFMLQDHSSTTVKWNIFVNFKVAKDIQKHLSIPVNIFFGKRKTVHPKKE